MPSPNLRQTTALSPSFSGKLVYSKTEVKTMHRIWIVLLACLMTLAVNAQPKNTADAQADPAHRDWHASWVTHPTAPLREPLVLHFRRALQLPIAPTSYPVRVSADNRFILFVNGQRVGDGPARGDLAHWRYERFDLAPYLKAGSNLITATVWNWGIFAPVAQFSDRTAFLLESEASGDTGISTPDNWQVKIEPGHKAMDRSSVTFRTYMAAGPGEELDAAAYDWNWQSPADTDGWVSVATPMRDSIHPGVNRAHSADTTGDNFWGLVPDRLPHMEYATVSAGAAVRVDTPGQEQLGWAEFPGKSLTLPPGIHFHVLLDRKALTTAYPQLTVSGGKGAQIRLTYAEALFDKEMHKGDRDEVANREAKGLSDLFQPDGGQHRIFEPLWWRTWRYLDLEIETKDQPLTIESLQAQFTAYPFTEKASFESADEDLKKIWEVSWRTARLDAHETYMDTPYYEQLQYVGDTRLQALISYAVAGDGRLGKQAIEAFDQSRISDGITRSRYPSALPQSIPTFSLLWVGMVHDWWMYQPDPEVARNSLAGTRTVMNWFEGYEQPDGLLRQLPWWSFIDWVPKGTIPTYDANGESCMTTLQYLGALEDAAALETGLGDPLFASRYGERAAHVRAGLRAKCWDPARNMVAETPEHKLWSQQASILGVLFDVVPEQNQHAVMENVLKIQPGDKLDDVLSASWYFRFYLARALDHAGIGEEYLGSLQSWRQLLKLHFSTWPEEPGNTRSDSHAWSAHPIYDLLTLVAGIEPASPSFKTVRIAPHLGSLPSLKATYPHPQGTIAVDYQWSPEQLTPQTTGGRTFHAKVTLPGTLTGRFEFDGKSWPLKPGPNSIDIPSK
jgi:hypothetical protein